MTDSKGYNFQEPRHAHDDEDVEHQLDPLQTVRLSVIQWIKIFNLSSFFALPSPVTPHVTGEEGAGVDKAGNVADDNEENDEVIIENNWREYFELIQTVIGGQEAVVLGHVGEDDTAVAAGGGVDDGDGEAEEGGETLGVEEDQEELTGLGVAAGEPHLGELAGDGDGHGVHPQEEADEGVVRHVAEEVAERAEAVVAAGQGQQLGDAVEEVVEADVDEEPDHQLPEQRLPQVADENVCEECEEDEDAGDHQKTGIHKDQNTLHTIFMFFVVINAE